VPIAQQANAFNPRNFQGLRHLSPDFLVRLLGIVFQSKKFGWKVFLGKMKTAKI
jgi:hypothetical protein